MTTPRRPRARRHAARRLRMGQCGGARGPARPRLRAMPSLLRAADSKRAGASIAASSPTTSAGTAHPSSRPTRPPIGAAASGPTILPPCMAAKRLERPVLVGWSMGGRVIRQYLMVHGDARLAGHQLRRLAGDRGPALSRAGGAQAAAGRARRSPRRSRRRSPSSTAATAGSRPKRSSAGRSPTTCGCRLRCGGRSPAGRPMPRRRSTALRKVRVPTLITHGREDTVVLPAAADMTVAAMPHARLSWFDGAGIRRSARTRRASTTSCWRSSGPARAGDRSEHLFLSPLAWEVSASPVMTEGAYWARRSCRHAPWRRGNPRRRGQARGNAPVDLPASCGS